MDDIHIHRGDGPISRQIIIFAYIYHMKKARKHKIKQANTLETSQKVLYAATMNALHHGGFLFARRPDGIIFPVVVNATISDITSSVITFAMSRAQSNKEILDLKEYIISILDRAAQMREDDIARMAKAEDNKMSEIVSVIADAESKAGKDPTPLDVHFDAGSGGDLSATVNLDAGSNG